ncbi:MAG: o-succinylbenzoate synthase [Chloroflexi bacterium]|nr:o-succinylbenzoate synthase [Chloroflexota bacterium]
MKIERIELRRIYLPYVRRFETSGWYEDGSFAIIVRVDADGVTGWGEAPVSDGPWYNEETYQTAWFMMQTFLGPLLLGADLDDPRQTRHLFKRVRANRMAKSGLEFAVWDLFAREQTISLSQLLGGTRDKVEVGVSVPIRPDIPALLETVEGYLNNGYKRVKIKIKPGWDVQPTRAIRERWPNLRLQVDGNSIYHLSDAEHLKELDQFDLLLNEQPLDHDDIFDHAKLAKLISTPLCLDESIVSPDHARWAIELNACRIINIKPTRIGGLADAVEIHDLAQAAGMPVWHGGMLETGIGRATNVALASLPNFSLPGDISANDRYFPRDIVHNPFTLNSDSTLTVPTAPGNGAVVDEAYLEAVTQERLVLK